MNNEYDLITFSFYLLETFLYQMLNWIFSDGLYGTWRKASTSEAGWNLPQPKMANTDLSALLKSEAIRAVLRAPNRKVSRAVVRTNPLKNIRTMLQVGLIFSASFNHFPEHRFNPTQTSAEPLRRCGEEER